MKKRSRRRERESRKILEMSYNRIWGFVYIIVCSIVFIGEGMYSIGYWKKTRAIEARTLSLPTGTARPQRPQRKETKF